MPVLAAIDFLHSRALLEAFRTGVSFPGEVRWGSPPEANRLLVSGQADMGLLSTVEWARRADDFLLLERIGIVSRGPVGSIRLYDLTGARPPRKVNATTDSETGTALVSVLYPGVTIARFSATDPNLFANADAALLIGDAALRENRPHRDLGAVWTEHTGLPFVWAVGVVRKDSLAREPNRILRAIEAWEEANVRGEEMDEEISAASGLPPEFARTYLESLRRAGRDIERWDGLERFLREAKPLGIIPRLARLDFFRPALARI